jgi:hypothetical protein
MMGQRELREARELPVPMEQPVHKVCKELQVTQELREARALPVQQGHRDCRELQGYKVLLEVKG